ncbi:MAG: paraquat-inducible membrane protein A [Alcaligenaceae bacterium]|nr:paraquat-inducible membrane protein A [Alcaligenaceae bacterium]
MPGTPAESRETGARLIVCRHCDTLHAAVAVEPGGMAVCSRCGYALIRQSRFSLSFWLALTAAALVIFAIANWFPIAQISMLGKTVNASFVGALWLNWQNGHHILSVMTGLVGFWLPLTQLCFLFWALGSIRKGYLPPDFSLAMRIYHAAGPWSMVPVLMLAIIVAIVKFAGLANLQPAPGIWAFGVLTFMLTAFSRLDSVRLWRYAEDAGLVPASRDTGLPADAMVGCPVCGYVQERQPLVEMQQCARCGSGVHKRRPDMEPRVWAFLIAAAVVYIPANVLPMMEIRSMLGTSKHTILGGVVELWRLGSWDLAVIVFAASVVVPITKLAALVTLMVARKWKGERLQRQRTRLYELVEFIGQWSMLDVFVVILMAAMANFPGMSQVIAGPAAASFGMVVVLTMLAAMSYDPRKGWDRDSSQVPGGSKR